jgi:hypothetical protein
MKNNDIDTIIRDIIDGTYKPKQGENPVFTRSNPLETGISDAVKSNPELLELAKPAIVEEFGKDKYNLDDNTEATYALLRYVRRRIM